MEFQNGEIKINNEKQEQEQKLVEIAFKFAQKGMDIEKVFNQINDLMNSELVKELMNLTYKNYEYLSKFSKNGSEKKSE